MFEIPNVAGEPVLPNEATVPLLPCVAPQETLAFWRALGFDATYEQTKPYLYLAFRWRGFELHYKRACASSNTTTGQPPGR
ncbi:MAG TPA: hypothetical protein VF062_01590 [Candidatus Limnocylindrales bacterium]